MIKCLQECMPRMNLTLLYKNLVCLQLTALPFGSKPPYFLLDPTLLWKRSPRKIGGTEWSFSARGLRAWNCQDGKRFKEGSAKHLCNCLMGRDKKKQAIFLHQGVRCSIPPPSCVCIKITRCKGILSQGLQIYRLQEMDMKVAGGVGFQERPQNLGEFCGFSASPNEETNLRMIG